VQKALLASFPPILFLAGKFIFYRLPLFAFNKNYIKIDCFKKFNQPGELIGELEKL
jgi:hypothetical protein